MYDMMNKAQEMYQIIDEKNLNYRINNVDNAKYLTTLRLQQFNLTPTD